MMTARPIRLSACGPGTTSDAMKTFLGLAVALVVVVITRVPWLSLGVLERLELSTIDARFSIRGPSPALPDSADVVIVEIGEESFRSLPDRFPWPRTYYARLIRNLNAAGARVIALDLIFGDSDSRSPLNDSAFVSALRTYGNVVLAGKREQDASEFVVSTAGETFGNVYATTSGLLGLVNIRSDADGIFRLYNPYFLVDSATGGSRAVPTFSLAVLNAALRLPPQTVARAEGSGFRYADRLLPRYDAGSFLINYYGPAGSFPRVKFHEVIDDSSFTTNEERETGEELNLFSDPDYGIRQSGIFRNKIVLVGVTVPEYKDLFPVSVGRAGQRGSNLMYGVELHANVIQSVLRNEFISMAPAPLDLTMIAAGVALSLWVTSYLRGSRSRRHAFVELQGVGVVLVLLAAVVGGAAAVFVYGHLVITVTGGVFAVAGGYSASTLYHYIVERRQRLLIKGMFSTYVNPAVVEQLIDHPASMSLGGKEKELTVLFSDVVGFTTISEQYTPEGLVSLLNEYMNVMTAEVFKTDGTLDKFIGDAVMAFWGDPLACEDHALRACKTALGMRRALVELNKRWEADGKPPLDMRIGINTGDMVVGNMGGTGKFAYTVIGDSVNLGSRLEGANKQYGTHIIISFATFLSVRREVVARELDTLAVKGRNEPVTVYELMAIRGEDAGGNLEEFLTRYNEGIFRYRCREWDAAIAAFLSALELRPEDFPARMYVERSESFRTDPPPPDWNGVYVMRTK
jgi:adenylate cyclase